MTFRNLIKQLDDKLNYERLEIIVQQLNSLSVDYHLHQYISGTNLFVDLGEGKKRIGVSSHFDRVQDSAGANDNGSAVAVCLDLIKTFKERANNDIAIRVFFFDEEETGLKGSSAYVKEFGTDDLIGLMNLELVGLGDKFAIWPVSEDADLRLLVSFESASRQRKIVTRRFDRIIKNSADHVPFQKAGLKDAFTVTCISDKDIETAQHYYRALEFEVDKQTLSEILSDAPIFEHYHKITDTYDRLSEASLSMTSATIWDTIVAVHKISSATLN